MRSPLVVLGKAAGLYVVFCAAFLVARALWVM